MSKYDVIMIGGGPGGYVAAVRCTQLGLKTVVAEKEAVGGTCVNWGCIPTKSLLRNAEVVHLLGQGRTYGFALEGLSVDYAAAQKRSRQVSTRQGRRVQALLKTSGVEVIAGKAVLSGPRQVRLEPSGELLEADNIILATGSQARQIPGMEPDGKRIITFRQALELTQAPASVVVVGGGPIGLEFASVWNRYGSKITVVEMMPRIMPLEDPDVSEEVARQYKKAKMDIRVEAAVKKAELTDAGVAITVTQGEDQEVIEAEMMLSAIGFVPNTKGLGLEESGVAMNRIGQVEIDEQMRSSLPGVYAIGDITGKLALAHTASAQGVIAAEAIAGRATEPLVYENIPRCTFGAPESASVGLTEAQAAERGYEPASQQSPLAPNGKAVALNENAGFIKIIADAKSRRVLGVHMVGPHVTEMIGGAAMALNLGATVEQMAGTVFPHPTVSEAMMEGLHALAGHAIHI
jgi:dihydrolipoamide dehydrogenase